MKRKLPREEKEEKKNKKAKRMKTKEEQKADKNKKEEKEKLEQKKNKSEKIKKKVKVEKTEKKQKKEIKEVEKSQPKEEIIEKQQEEKLQPEESIKEQQQDKKVQDEETQRQNKEENDLMIKEKSLNELQLEKIEKEIKTQAIITEEKKNKINKKIFQNIAIAIGIVLYFIFINLGFTNIKPETYYKDLQVFSMISIIFTIVLMEKAYKKDNNELTIHTIEALVFSICTLLTIYIRNYYSNKFISIINTIAILFAIYYIGKCIIIDYKMTKKAKKRAREKRKLLNE